MGTHQTVWLVRRVREGSCADNVLSAVHMTSHTISFSSLGSYKGNWNLSIHDSESELTFVAMNGEVKEGHTNKT